jgi:hypothetical protein
MKLERGTRARLTAAVVLFLVLGAGVVLGVALDRQLEARGIVEAQEGRPQWRPGEDQRRRGFDPRSRDPSRGPREGRDSTHRRPALIVEEVGLSEGQQAQADSIYWLYRGKMRALHEEFDAEYNSRFREIMSQSREDMLAILTTEQREVYDSLLAEWDRRREERREDSIPDGREEGSVR